MIGNNIRALLKKKHMTQAQLATATGLAQSAISEIVSGVSSPRKQSLQSIAEALGVSVADLEAEETWPEKMECPRCGSGAVVVWESCNNGAVRIRCNYCEADTGEQRSRAQAYHVFLGFRKVEKVAEEARAVRPLELAELLDWSNYDGEAVRPVWFENRGLFIVPSLLQCGLAERDMDCVKVEWRGSYGQKTYMLDQYGSWWRAWNGKPSQAVADGTPWIDK